MLSTTILACILTAQSDLFQYSVRHSLAGRHDYIQFSSDGTRALALAGDRFERINLSDGSLTAFAAPSAGKSALTVSASRDLSRALIGATDGSVYFLQESGSFHALRAHKGCVIAVAVSADGSIAASAGTDKRVLIWDLGTQAIRHTLTVKTPASFLLIRASTNSLIGIGADGSIHEWDSNSSKTLRQMQDSDNSVHAAALNPSGTLLGLGTEFSALTKGSPMRAAHPSDFHRESHLRLYDLTTGRNVKEIGQVQGQIRSLSISPDGRFAVATRHRQRDAFFAVFDLARGVEIASSGIPLDSLAIDFAPDGRWLALPLQDGRLGLSQVSGVQRGNTVGDLSGQKIVLTSANSEPVFPSSSLKVSVAILNFEARNLDADTGAAIADMIRNRLAGSPHLELVDRTRMDQILSEQNVQNSDRVDSATAVRLGKILNVRKLIFGSVSQLGTSFTINAQIVDVETSRVDGIREVLCQRCQLDDLPRAASVLGEAMLQQK